MIAIANTALPKGINLFNLNSFLFGLNRADKNNLENKDEIISLKFSQSARGNVHVPANGFFVPVILLYRLQQHRILPER